MEKPLSLLLVVLMILFSTVLLDFQFKQMTQLQFRAYKREISYIEAITKEFQFGFFTGTVLNYGTSTMGYRLYDKIGLTLGLSLPIVGSTYLKIVEVWRKMLLFVFESVYPIGFLLGSLLGLLLFAIEFTLFHEARRTVQKKFNFISAFSQK